MVQTIISEELAKIWEAYCQSYDEEKMNQATDVFTVIVSENNFEEFPPYGPKISWTDFYGIKIEASHRHFSVANLPKAS